MSRISGIKQRIKRELHYWFGKVPYTTQIGDFIIFDPCSDSDYKEEDAKVVFSDQIVYSLLFLKAEIISKSLVLITQYPFTSSDDPLGQNTTFAWEANIIIHTRRTWKQYQLKLLKTQVVFKNRKGESV